MKEYNKSNIPLAKELRKNMTPWERKLWYEFLRGYPVKFQRQKAIGDYIVDFYCAKAKPVIELDGSGHCENGQLEYDRLRTEKLEQFDLRVLRISNLDVDRNFYGVCEYIDRAVKDYPSGSQARHLRFARLLPENMPPACFLNGKSPDKGSRVVRCWIEHWLPLSGELSRELASVTEG